MSPHLLVFLPLGSPAPARSWSTPLPAPHPMLQQEDLQSPQPPTVEPWAGHRGHRCSLGMTPLCTRRGRSRGIAGEGHCAGRPESSLTRLCPSGRERGEPRITNCVSTRVSQHSAGLKVQTPGCGTKCVGFTGCERGWRTSAPWMLSQSLGKALRPQV